MKRPKIWGVSLLVLAATTGCGSPNLADMRPDVAKPSAEVLLVDGPHQWSVSTVDKIAAAHQVIVETRQVSSQGLPQALENGLKNKTVSLFVVVSAGSIPPSVQATLQSHLTRRFDWISGSSASGQVLNLAYITPDSVATSYMLGFLSSALGTALNTPSVGWIGPASSPAARAALGGIYAANANMSVTVAGTVPSQTVTTSPLPKVVLATRVLSQTEWLAVQQAGSYVVSTVPQTGSQLVGDPDVPLPAALDGELALLAEKKWDAGARSDKKYSAVYAATSIVPQNVLQALNAVVTSVETGMLDPGAAWNSIPQATRTAWQTALAGAS